MRPLILVLLSVLFACTASPAQDMIIRKDGDTVKATVTMVSATTITYSSNDSIRSISPAAVSLIIYANGTRDVFYQSGGGADSGLQGYTSLSEKGKRDAKLYYQKYHASKSATAVLAALYPFFAFIPTLVIVSTPPKEKNLGYPHPDLMQQNAYRTAYEEQAFKIKKRQTWRGYGNGTLVVGGLTLGLGLLFAATPHHR